LRAGRAITSREQAEELEQADLQKASSQANSESGQPTKRKRKRKPKKSKK
jgi:hypothetical protein